MEQRCALHKNNQLSLPSSLLFGVLLFCKIWHLTKLGDGWKPSFPLNMPQSFCETSKKAIYMRWLPMWLCDSISYMSLKEEGIFVVSALERSEVGRSNPAVRWGSDLMRKRWRKKGDTVRDLEKGAWSGINLSCHSHDINDTWWKKMPLFELLNS